MLIVVVVRYTGMILEKNVMPAQISACVWELLEYLQRGVHVQFIELGLFG